MLSVNATLENEKIVLHDLQDFAHELPAAARRGLSRSVKGIHRAAYDFLSGPGRTPMRLTDKHAIIHEDGRITNRKSRLRGQSDDLGARPGSYPVPVITGNLRRLLDFVEPGHSKGEFTAAADEAIVYDSAEYAGVIHEGDFSSSKYGPRAFLTDGLEEFGGAAELAEAVTREVDIEIKTRRLD